ncbi:MAG: T9SS type A sorting domain-containing protein [Crocinitomicaceae bacterium]
MKKSLKYSLLLLIVTFNLQAQLLDFNNVGASLNTNGILFHQQGTNTPGYEIPKNSGLKAIYAASLWCGAEDVNGNLHLAAMRFGQNGNDFFPGPFSSTNDYTATAYTSAYGTSVWHVTYGEIQNHISNYATPGYVMPTGIATWPGNGIAGAGVAQNLAPFIDLNNNGLYEPMLGEYPDIRGDAAYYMIMNDSKNLHTETGGERMGIEVHTMAYQYLSTDYLNLTTFLHYRVFNRGIISYPNFKLGMWWDPDLGNPLDDYVGCDTIQNMMYVYNADNVDESAVGTIGYGMNPPALGISSLTKKMEYFTYFTNGSAFPYTDPVSATQYFNFMNGLWSNGQPMYYGGNGTMGSTPTHYLFSGNPNIPYQWSESDTIHGANPPGDRRGVMTLEAESLSAGSFACYDFAVLYARDAGSNHVQNVNFLTSLAATAKMDFESMAMYNCNVYTADLEQLDANQIGLYPNPSNGNFNLTFGESVNGSVQITDMAGRIVFEQTVSNQSSLLINLTEANGIYQVTIATNKGIVHKKISIQE